jgi:YegS/Rv2252/BmrU family lipid kinase
MNRICFIVNPLAGSRDRTQTIRGLIEEIIKPAGIEYTIDWINGPGDGSRLAAEAVARGFDVVAAVGGDGTVNEVGQALVGKSAALGVIPAGSGNGFARNLRVPLNLPDALRLLLSPRIIRIDAGTINSRYFFSIAGIGLDAEISKSFEQHGSRGTLSYFLAGIKPFFMYRPSPMNIHHEGGTFTASPLVMSIANGPQYGSGAIIAPRAQPDDGMLDVCMIDTLSAWTAITNLHRLFNGTIEQIPGYRSLQTRSLRIERTAPGLIHVDGDPQQAEAVLQVAVLPGKLRVAAGKE